MERVSRPDSGVRPRRPPVSLFLVLIILFAVGISATFLLLAFANLQQTGRQNLWEEIGKLCAQFLLVILLGLLVTGTLEYMKARRDQQRAARQRKEEHIRRLINLTHDLDHARLLLRASRSMEAWSEQMITRIIPAYTELRDMYHDHVTVRATGKPFFRHDEEIMENLEYMGSWFNELCTEYSRHKKLLSGSLRNPLRGRRDSSGAKDLWPYLHKLPHLFYFVVDEHDEADYENVLTKLEEEYEFGQRIFIDRTYRAFRQRYLDTLWSMRLEFSKARLQWPVVGRRSFPERVPMSMAAGGTIR